jgi:hypothetical protein
VSFGTAQHDTVWARFDHAHLSGGGYPAVFGRGRNAQVIRSAAIEKGREPRLVFAADGAEFGQQLAQRHAAGGGRCGEIRVREKFHLFGEVGLAARQREIGLRAPEADE